MDVQEELNNYFYNKVNINMPNEIKSALMDYSSNSYVYIREVLSGHTNLTQKSINCLKQNITLIREAFKYSYTPIPLTLYHGCESIWFNDDDRIIKPTSFFSSSLSKDIGLQFVGFPIEEGSLLEINIPAGYPSIWMRPLSFHSSEQEILLDLDIELEIQDKKHIKDEHGRHYELVDVNVKKK